MRLSSIAIEPQRGGIKEPGATPQAEDRDTTTVIAPIWGSGWHARPVPGALPARGVAPGFFIPPLRGFTLVVGHSSVDGWAGHSCPAHPSVQLGESTRDIVPPARGDAPGSSMPPQWGLEKGDSPRIGP